MTEFGLTPSGFVAPRSSDWQRIIREDFEARVGVEIDWSRQTVLGPMSVVFARRLGSLTEVVVAHRDARSINNAAGVQLDDLAQTNLTERDEAIHSTVEVELTSTTGSTNDVFVEEESKVQGGGDDNRAEWETQEAVEIPPGGGTVTVTAKAVEPGPIGAGAGAISTILSPVSGWASVTNPADAVIGEDEESNASLRRRVAQAPYRAGRGGVLQLRETIRDLDFVTTAHVLDNDTHEDVTIGTVDLTPNSMAAIVWPDTLTSAEEAELAGVLFETKGGGIRLLGDEEATITLEEVEFTVRWSYATATPVVVEFFVKLEPGYDRADVEAGLQEMTVDYFSDLTPGQDVLTLDLLCAANQNVAGIRSLSIELNGSSADLVISPTFIAQLSGDATVTEV